MPPGKGEVGMPVAAPLVIFYSVFVKLNSISGHGLPQSLVGLPKRSYWACGDSGRLPGAQSRSTAAYGCSIGRLYLVKLNSKFVKLNSWFAKKLTETTRNRSRPAVVGLEARGHPNADQSCFLNILRPGETGLLN